MSAIAEPPPVAEEKKTRTVKVQPVLYRQGTSELQSDGSIRLSISSDRPYLRYDYWNDEEFYEVLSHDPQDVDLTRINAGTALLFNHDRDVHLGLITKPELTQGKCFVSAKVSKADDVASYRTRIEEGILKDCSVGYEIEDEGEKIGEKDGIPIYRFKWSPFEASLVTVPADISVGVGRERSQEKPKGEPKEILIREKSSQEREKEIDTDPESSQKRETAGIETTTMSTPAAAEPKPKTDAELAAEKRERDEFLKQERENDRARQKEIRAIAKRAGNVPDDLIEKAIDEETTADEFRKMVFEKFWGNPDPLETPLGESDGDLGRNQGKGQTVRTIGDIVIVSDEFKKRSMPVNRGVFGKKAAIEIPDRTNFRTTLVSGAGGVGITNIQYIPDILQVLQQRLTVADLLGAGQTDKGSITYPQQTTYVNTTAVTAEGAAKPEVTFVFTETNAPVRKIAGWTKISEEVLEDFPAVKSVIDQQLPFMVQQTEETELVSGDGTGQHLTGLLNQSGIQVQAKGSATPAATNVNAIYNAITKIRVNAFLEPDGVVIHPNDWQIMRLTTDANGQYYAGGPFTGAYGNAAGMVIDRIWGLPVVVTTAITQGTALVGAFKIGAMVFRRKGLTVQMYNQNEDDAKKNLVMLIAEERLGLVVWRPSAFCKVTGIA